MSVSTVYYFVTPFECSVSQVDNQSLSIPVVWSKTYPSIFKLSCSNEVFIKSATPTPLTVIVVTALSSEAYSQASGEASPLEAWFSDELYILRQGDIFQVDTKLSSAESIGIRCLRYRLEMLEPVLQGYAQRDATKIVLLSSHDEQLTIQTAVEDSEDNEETDLVEIDESFLANAFSMPPESSRPQSHNQGSDQFPLSPDNSVSVGYVVQCLNAPFNPLEDHCTFYIRPTDLGKLGILSGDWVSVLFFFFCKSECGF